MLYAGAKLENGAGTDAFDVGGGGASDPLDLPTDYTTSVPASPTTGIRIYSDATGRRRPAWVGVSGQSTSVQSFLAGNTCRLWAATGTGALSFTMNIVAQVTGTAAIRNLASDTHYNSFARYGYVGASAAVNIAAGMRHNIPQFFRGNPSGAGAPGGFEVGHLFGIANIGSGGRGFFGMVNTGSALAGSAVPSALLNCIGVGFDSGDTNFSAYTNDGSGAATKVDLGSGFPCRTLNTDMYESRVFIAPRGEAALVTLRNRTTGAFVAVEFTTNLPAIGFLLAEQMWLSSGTDAISVGLDICKRYIETDT